MTAHRLAWLERELEAAVGQMTAAVAAAPRDAEVSTCPGWDVAALAAHLVGVHRWAGAVVLTGAQQDFQTLRAAPPDDLAGWYARSGSALLAALRSVEPDEPAWNFTGADQRAAFWWRRQLHEVSVHTADAVLAGGGRPTVEAVVAADGVDEVLAVWPRRLAQRGHQVAVIGPVEVVTTDTGDHWLLEPGDPYATVRRDGGAGVGRVAGPAAELYLRLWGRGGEEHLTVDGEVARAWLDGPRVP